MCQQMAGNELFIQLRKKDEGKVWSKIFDIRITGEPRLHSNSKAKY